MKREEYRERIRWLLNHSSALFFCSLTAVLLGRIYKLEPDKVAVGFFLLGIGFTYLMLGNGRAAISKRQGIVNVLVFVFLGRLLSPHATIPAGYNIPESICYGICRGLYHCSCVFSAVFLLFILFRQPFLTHLGVNDPRHA